MGRPRAVIFAPWARKRQWLKAGSEATQPMSLLTLTARQEINPQGQWQEHAGLLQAWHPAGAQGQSPEVLWHSFRGLQ